MNTEEYLALDFKDNMVLHPEFVEGKYALYTRPQDGFISVGSGGGTSPVAVG